VPVVIGAGLVMLSTLEAGLTAPANQGSWRAVARWSMAVLAVAAIAIAIAMAVDGVFDV
jgi:anti-sigma-K factor RskA